MRNLWEEKLVLLGMAATTALGQSVVVPFTPLWEESHKCQRLRMVTYLYEVQGIPAKLNIEVHNHG